MLGKHVIFCFSSINYIVSVDYIFLLNITYVFAIITCLGFPVLSHWIICMFDINNSSHHLMKTLILNACDGLFMKFVFYLVTLLYA